MFIVSMLVGFYQNKINKLQQEIESQKKSQYQAQIASLEGEKQELLGQIISLQETNVHLQTQQRTNSEEELKETQQELQQAKEELQQAFSKIQRLESRIQSLEKELVGCYRQLDRIPEEIKIHLDKIPASFSVKKDQSIALDLTLEVPAKQKVALEKILWSTSIPLELEVLGVQIQDKALVPGQEYKYGSTKILYSQPRNNLLTLELNHIPIQTKIFIRIECKLKPAQPSPIQRVLISSYEIAHKNMKPTHKHKTISIYQE
jgi:hypothetical protein